MVLGITRKESWLNLDPVLGNMNKHINTHKTLIETPTRKSLRPARVSPHKVLFLTLLWEFISFPAFCDCSR